MLNMHAHIEVLKEETWHHLTEVTLTNFILIAAINGQDLEYLRESIRSRITPQAMSNEIPKDATELTRICYEYDQNRVISKGHMTKTDLVCLQEHLHEINPYADKSKWKLEHLFRTTIHNGTLAEHIGFDDVRIIFWCTES